MFETYAHILPHRTSCARPQLSPCRALAADQHMPSPKEASLRLHINAGTTGAVCVPAVMLCPSSVLQGALDSF